MMNETFLAFDCAHRKYLFPGARIIQSRFRQAAAAAATTTRKGPMKATDRVSVDVWL